MHEKHAAVDRALGLVMVPLGAEASLPLRLVPPAVVTDRGAIEEALRDTVPATDWQPGDLYVDGRDASLPEFVILHLGCGRKQRLAQLPPFRMFRPGADGTTEEVFPPIRLINLDGMATTGAHLVCRLGEDAINLPANSVDLIFAAHVLEHIGYQGELGEWFHFWGEAYRVLKPQGRLQFESPYYTSVWCWADPTHTRAISEFVFVYLNHDSYRVPPEQTAIPDYRPPCDFELKVWELVADTTNPQLLQREGRSHMRGTLVARKPFRPYWEECR